MPDWPNGAPLYFSGARGTLLGVYHAPTGPCRGRVLHLPAFAEEANAARRLVAQTARAMAAQGWAVLLIDLWGCGDSAGDFQDVRWQDWQGDAWAALQCLNAITPEPPQAQPLWLWGLRSGAMLALDIAHRLDLPPHLLMWQPVWQGKQVLQHWLRIHSAKGWLQPADHATARAPEPAPQQRWAQGQTQWLGGYPLTSALATDLQALAPQIPACRHGQMTWLEVFTPPAPTEPPMGTARMLTQWTEHGWQAHWQAIEGIPFWDSMGFEPCDAVVQASLSTLSRA